MNVMLLKRMSLAISVVLFFSGCASQTPNETKPAEKATPAETQSVRGSADVVKVETPIISTQPGIADATVTLAVSPGYHVNANPATFDYLIATELTADKSDGITFGKPVYPAAVKRQFQFAEQPLAVYEGQVQIKLPVHTMASAAKGNRTVGLHVRVQACDEEKCFPPATLQRALTLDVK